jgi:hypothetical protein
MEGVVIMKETIICRGCNNTGIGITKNFCVCPAGKKLELEQSHQQIMNPQFQMFKVNEYEYVFVIVNAKEEYEKIISELDRIENKYSHGWIKHQMGSSSGYDLYEIYGNDAQNMAEEVTKCLSGVLRAYIK